MFKTLKQKIVGVLTAVTGLAMVGAANAATTLDPSVSAAFQSISDNATAMFALAMPVVASVLGLFIVIRLFKKFGKAAS